MKRVLLLLVGIVFVSVSFGQSVREKRNSVTQYMDVSDNVTYWYKTNVTVTETDTLAAYTFGVDNLYDELKQYLSVKLTENSGTAAVNVKFQGKYFWDDTWTDLKDATYAGTGTDTTILFDGSTAKHYRFYRLLLDGDGTGTFDVTMSKSELQFYK